ncbi:hypothetical protein ND856_18940 [Leptospira bandrabouensis]|uniref:hypothetical protein n=1 Tax=Leptospira bandrabouensis TaxID=2484903 RepID=UPI00223CF995|nr:hypothetical protein [Leptospira bandrabouensis]MCW7479384.1 hypothetical protein [Leptospira bandrabouensis]MCW7487036.1 hypothetical protein [Leptospira bandrabouensis]
MKNKILKLSKNPILTLVSIFLTIISFILAIFFYLESKKERDPFFVLNNYNEPIVKLLNSESENDLDFSIYIKSKKGNFPINGEIYSTRIYFWNNGKESIKRENILQKLKIYPDLKSKIVGVRILRNTRPEISNFKAILNKELNEITLDFDIIEENDGVTLQILFNGSQNEIFKIKGIIEGVKKIKESNKFSPPVSTSIGILITISGFAIVIILGLIVIYIIHITLIKIYQILFKYTKINIFKELLDKENEDPGRFINFLLVALIMYIIFFLGKTFSIDSNNIPEMLKVDRINGA